MTRSIYGWDLPPGCTLDDIDRLDEPTVEMSEKEAQRFDALMREDSEHTRNGYGAFEPYYEDPFLPNYDGEISVTGALDAILNEEIEDDGLTGKSYESDETPLTEEEAQEVIEEMRKAVSSDGTISLASAVANELGLELEVAE